MSKNRLWKNRLQFIIPLAIILVGFSVCAQVPPSFPNPIDPVNDIPQLVAKVLGYIVTITIPLAGLAVIIAGLNYVFAAASANSGRITKANQILTWVLIGAGIVIGALVIATAVYKFLVAL